MFKDFDEDAAKGTVSNGTATCLLCRDAHLKNDPKAKAYLASDALPAYSKGAVRLERK